MSVPETANVFISIHNNNNNNNDNNNNNNNCYGSTSPNLMSQVKGPKPVKVSQNFKRAHLKGEITKILMEQSIEVIYDPINTLIYYHLRQVSSLTKNLSLNYLHFIFCFIFSTTDLSVGGAFREVAPR